MPMSNDGANNLKRIAEYKQGYGRDIGFYGDGTRWATASTGLIHLWNGSELLKSIDVPDYVQGSIRFSPDGQAVYVGAWRVDTATYETSYVLPNRDILIATIDLEDNPRSEQFGITHAEWTADVSKFVARTMYRPSREIGATDDYTGPDNQIIILDALTPYLVADLELESMLFPDRGLTLASRWIATGGEDVEVWDLETGDSVQSLDSDDYCQSVRFSPDESYLSSTHNDGTIYLWDTRDWLGHVKWKAHEDVTRGVAFHPTRPLLASFGGDEYIKLWSIRTSNPQQVAQIKMEREIEGLAFHPSGDRLYITASYPAPAVSIYSIEQ
jgi:WD40 repeat protein